MAEKKYEERDQFPTLIDGGQVDEAIVNTPPTEKGVFNTGITSTQIEQVVDLPIPTTDDSGQVLKVEAEGKWELSTDAEGTVVVANPTLAGTEADLVGIQIGATKYKVPYGANILALSEDSGTLTDEQYALVSGDNCIIKHSGESYYKTIVGQYIIYVVAHSYINPNTNQLSYLECQISDNKNYAFSAVDYAPNVAVNPTLAGTESALTGLQVGNQKYKVGGSEILAYEGTSLLSSGVVFENWTLHRSIKDGNILWVVLSGKITNTSGSSKTEYSFFSVTLPSQISSKIYRLNGTTCDNAESSSPEILNAVGYKSNSNNPVFYYLSSVTANVLQLTCSGLAIDNNGSAYVDVRIPIFLDIGD